MALTQSMYTPCVGCVFWGYDKRCFLQLKARWIVVLRIKMIVQRKGLNVNIVIKHLVIYIYVFFPSSMRSYWLLRGDMTYNNEAVVCFSLCYITNHTMTSPSGNSSFCFSRMSMFPSAGLRGTKWTVSLRTSHSVFNKCNGWTGLSSSAKNPATNWIWSICPVIRQYYYGVVIFPLLKLTSQ